MIWNIIVSYFYIQKYCTKEAKKNRLRFSRMGLLQISASLFQILLGEVLIFNSTMHYFTWKIPTGKKKKATKKLTHGIKSYWCTNIQNWKLGKMRGFLISKPTSTNINHLASRKICLTGSKQLRPKKEWKSAITTAEA